MKRTTLFTLLILGSASLLAFNARAGQSDVTCSYHHTLGDDSIMMTGKPNQAMLHDFFGNTHTDAFSTYDTLRAQPETTCNNKADSSAYWAPTMRLPDGEIVKPSYQKTYYQSTKDATNPLTPFPAGLALLAGDHHGSAPSNRITFLCGNGNGYSNKAGEVCGLRSKGDAVQFNVGIQFPDCWDGVHLMPGHGKPNAAYSSNGVCPADFPVKIPRVNLNLAWVLPQITSLDTAKIQFSMDPVMNGDQRTEQWGGVYTVHADFLNGWTEEGARFMTDLCMNNGMDCNHMVPWSYRTASEDTYVSSAEPDRNFGQSPDLFTRQNKTNGDQMMTLMKFPIPPVPAGLTEAQKASFKYQVRIYGTRVESGQDMIYFSPVASNSWHENNVTWNNRPAVAAGNKSGLYIGKTLEYRYVNVDNEVKKALAEGKTEISWYLGGDNYDKSYRFNSRETKENLVLMLTRYQEVKEN
ncbi:DUF1996 domain-containing protein [Trabulsiella odontotermitis]|uniref:DUF1996 domain-containing protein n=1 Tax=Trabulsiella odontotermitis TaxID=379893 RepID=UPI00067657C9|nr:DUF1996 domain-containing protein [Trabulsiella odontotermitis]